LEFFAVRLDLIGEVVREEVASLGTEPPEQILDLLEGQGRWLGLAVLPAIHRGEGNTQPSGELLLREAEEVPGLPHEKTQVIAVRQPTVSHKAKEAISGVIAFGRFMHSQAQGQQAHVLLEPTAVT